VTEELDIALCGRAVRCVAHEHDSVVGHLSGLFPELAHRSAARVSEGSIIPPGSSHACRCRSNTIDTFPPCQRAITPRRSAIRWGFEGSDIRASLPGGSDGPHDLFVEAGVGKQGSCGAGAQAALQIAELAACLLDDRDERGVVPRAGVQQEEGVHLAGGDQEPAVVRRVGDPALPGASRLSTAGCAAR
jgi:hypothetical protein